mgnify:CR=1 FL=1
MKHIFIAASALALLAGCAGDGVSTSQETGNFETADGKKVECRRIKEMGTRLGKRVCMEKEEWAEVDRAAEEAAEDFMGSSRGAQQGPTSPGL